MVVEGVEGFGFGVVALGLGVGFAVTVALGVGFAAVGVGVAVGFAALGEVVGLTLGSGVAADVGVVPLDTGPAAPSFC